MPRLTSYDRVCYPRVECHAMSDVVRLCVLPKGGDGMPHLTSFDGMFCQKAMMACHARRCSTVCVVQWQ